MGPLERIESEAGYLRSRACSNGFSIILQVSSAGAAFHVRDASDGRELYRSDITEPRTISEFYDAVDSAILTARLSRELGVSFS